MKFCQTRYGAYSDPVQSEVSTFVREFVNAYVHLAHFYLEHSKELEEYKSEFADSVFDANDEGDENTSGHYAYLDWFVNKKTQGDNLKNYSDLIRAQKQASGYNYQERTKLDVNNHGNGGELRHYRLVLKKFKQFTQDHSSEPDLGLTLEEFKNIFAD
ncbi:hypothetical protein [Oenococcus oeni]|uniref:hypothetical protein n=1 Tax=Oenococcus oeni TaxID=1247 RepID=UPI0012683EB1|nr:hypothetical protein [Oenococcus oeni]